jgi:DNA primase
MSEDVTRFFPRIKETHEGFQAQCPMCERGDFTLSWSVEKNVGACHHASCPWYTGRGGVTLKRLLGFFHWKGTEEYVPEIIQVSAEADVKLPEEFRLISDLDFNLKDTLLSYLAFRGFDRKTVYRAKIGYCEDGKFWGYLIAPVFDNGEVVYWQGRRFKNRTPKFYNPQSSRKSELLYCFRQIRKPKRIVLVESIFNTLTLVGESHSNLILGLLGKSLSVEQLDKILIYRNVTEIAVALDPDAIRDAIAIASQLVSLVEKVTIPIFPFKEDINSLGKQRSWEIISKAEQFKEKNRMKFLISHAEKPL